MSQEQISLSTVRNYGFFINPNMQDSQLKAQAHREQFWQGTYYFANSDRDQECKDKYNDIFGKESIPYDDENAAYFLGRAALHQQGFTGSPFQYFLQNRMELPAEVIDEETARIYIGNDIIKKMRAAYDKNKQDETILADVQNDLSGFLAPLVRMPSGYQGQPTDKDVADALNRMGVWDKISPSVDRARIAWLRMQHILQDVDHMQEAGRPELAELADVLSDDKGQLDEMAVLAFYSAVEQHATELQSEDSKLWANTIDKFQNFLARDDDKKDKEKREKELALSLAIGDYETADERGRYISDKVERMRGVMQSAMHTAMEPSEKAGAFATAATSVGNLLGDAIIPMAGSAAAVAGTRGKGGWAALGRAVAGWAGGLAVSKDSIINQAVAQAYLEGVENPEEYGYYAGLGQAAAENIAGVGTTGFMAFKGINRLMSKAAAKATTSKVLSNAYARAALALGATMGIEGTTELAEEEIGEALGSALNAMARATGSNVSEQKYVPLEAIKQMKPHQIASMYLFVGALGIGGAAANFAAAQEMSIDIGKLKAVGYSDKKAREVQAHGIETARKIEEVSNSNATAEEKKAQITAIQDERLEYLGKTFREDVANASNEELVKRSKEENAEFTYRSLLAWAIQNGLDEQALIDLGYMSAKRQPNGNYLLTYEEKGEGENAQPKLVQKEWNRDQLHGFMTFQRGTDVHMKLRELSGQLMAMQFAEKVASVEELKIQLANLRDTPITELATIMQHEAITPELFKAFAEKEAANIAADIAQGMTRQQAEMEPSKLLPGVARKDLIQTVTAAEERKQNAIAKGEIKPEQAVEYPGLNISRLDGTSLIAFFNQKITLPQMLEEMMEARLNQQAKNDPELYNKLGTILQGIQNKLKGVRILPKGKTSFSRGDIVEAYSHLAVAEVIANPAYTSHLSQREQAVVQDVLGSVFRAQRYKAIAGAWLNYKESAEGKAYLENGGKDLVDIFSEAGFTFGKHLEAKQATEEQKMKALEARNFLPDFNAETKLLENKAEAEQKLAEVNAKEAQEPTIIPSNESVTGEEIVITPEQKEAEQAPTVARPDFVKLVKALGEARYDVTFFKESTVSAQKRIEKWRSQGNEKMIEHEEKNIAYNQQKLEKLPQKIKDLEEAIANYNTSINAPNAVLTPEEQLLNKLRTPAATIRDFVTFFSKHRTTEANDIELGLHTKTQNGEDNPAYVMGKKIGNEVRSRSITTEEQYKNYFITSSVNEKITETAGELVTSTVLQQEATAAKKYAQTLRNNAKRSKGKLTQAQNAGGTLSLPSAPKWPTAPKKKNKHSAKQIVDILATTTSKDKGRYALNYVSQETQDGTVTYVSCDGRRISALSHKSNESDSKILLDPKTAEPAKEQVDYVGWRHVSRFDTPVIKTIDLAPMLALTKLRKRGKYHPTLSSDSATHKLIEIAIAGKHYTLNAAFLREAVEQLAALTKAYGFPSTVQIHDADIFVISATHGGLKWQCCIQPLTEADAKTEHNIVFSETSSFIRGAGSHVSATEIEKLQKVYEIDEANAQDAENEAAEIKQKAKDVAMLEEQLPPMEKHIRQAAGTTRNFSFAKATSLARDFERGNISVLMPTIPQQDAKTKWGRDLFERISGLTLPGTPEGNKAMAEQWAAEQAAKGTPINTSPDSSTSGANFSIQEAADKGMFQNGVLRTDNAIVAEPNFSIQAASLPDRFAGHPLAERMSNFMRAEARRYERTLSKQTHGDAATNALFATQSIIHAVDKYVRNGEFKLPRESMIRLKHARALIDKYAQMMKSGKVRSFNKIDKAEQAELLAAMAEAAEGIDADAINTMTPEEYAALKAEVEAEMKPELYRKHARALADDVAKSNLPEKEKIRTLSALHRIIKEGKLAKNTTLDKPEQRQLTELVENEAQDAIEKEARNREFKLTADKIQQDAKERNERMVRVAATGRIGELLRDMLNETADIVDLYLKSELLKKLKRITDSVKIKRSPSKTLKGKMGAAEYRRMDAIVELMEMSARAKDNALGEIENARRILNESKGEIPEVAEGSMLWEIINNLNEQGITVSVDTLNIELNNREADINVFANLDGMDYAEALNAARGLAGLIYFGRTAWQMKQAAEYERIKAFLDYFYEHTDSELGTSQAIDKGKKMKLGNIFNSSMNDAQLLFALAGHEGLRPVMDEMRRNLAMAQDARNLHIKSITNQIYATYARLIGMKPQTEAGYTDKQLREASNKFSMEFEKWNEIGKPNVVREWIDNDGVLKKQEMELSRLQALDLILTYRQQHYQPNADKHGYTEAVLNKLEEYCGTRLMAMGEAFKRTIQNDGTAQVYEERTGIPMYKDPSYWPGSININTINLTSEEPLVNPYNPAGTYNRLKQRVKNTNEAKYQNAFEKWKHAIAEGANYIYLYPITNTLNRMLAHREFANRLHGLIGSDLFSQLRLMLNVLDSSTWQETALRDEANNWAASMLKATAPAVLALNPGTMARQLSAINNYAMLPGIRIWRLPATIALIKQDKSAIKLSDIMQLDSFRARYRDNAEVNDMLGLGPNAKFSTYNKWAKAGMNIIDRLDIWSNAVSACLYYNMLYEQMQEKNQGAANPLSEEEIRNICEQNVSQLLRLVAQPLEKANKSAMYWKYGSTWMGSIFLYMSTEMVNKTGMLRATYIKNKAEGMPFHKNAWQLIYKMGLGLGGMTFLIEAGLFLLLSGDLPDDEKEWLAALFSLALYSAFGQYLSRIPFIGSVTDYYLSPYGQYTTNKNQQQNPALSIDQTSAKLLKMMSDNKHYSASEWQVAYTRFVRDLTAVSGLASGLVPQAQWISTTTATLQSLSAAMNTVYPVARSVQMDSWMRNITPDWYKPKKTKKRAKSALEEALTPEPEKKKGRKSK